MLQRQNIKTNDGMQVKQKNTWQAFQLLAQLVISYPVVSLKKYKSRLESREALRLLHYIIGLRAWAYNKAFLLFNFILILVLIICKHYSPAKSNNLKSMRFNSIIRRQTWRGVPVKSTRWLLQYCFSERNNLESLFFRRWPSSTIYM
jgi:hypothetical protein